MKAKEIPGEGDICVERMACARIPTDVGEFQLCYYRNNVDEKEHLALLIGEVEGEEEVLVRVHSECFTGDVLGSLRCDCGPQLQRAMQLIAEEKRGVIIYLRQEGRNIGLLDKLRAYNLQDQGYDTVEANLLLGHQADSRSYVLAAMILKDLGVSSVRLLTNNPQKIADIEKRGISVSARVPLQESANQENLKYLMTKARRMRHMLDMDLLAIPEAVSSRARPYVTLSYAQSLDGSIASRRGGQTILSGSESMMMTHRIRAEHDAVLVGIGTVLADDPRLTVRLVEGDSPRPIVLDTRLRFPPSARLLRGPKSPWIITLDSASSEKQRILEETGARVIRLAANQAEQVDLAALLTFLYHAEIRSVMVEGGAAVITSFLSEGHVDRLVLTIAPTMLAGIPAVESKRIDGAATLPRLDRPFFRQLGNDIVVIGDLAPLA